MKKTLPSEGAFYCLIQKLRYGRSWDEDLAASHLQTLTQEHWTKSTSQNIKAALLVLWLFLPRIYDVKTINSNCYIEMENLLHVDIEADWNPPAFSAMDLKIGTQLWGIDADNPKRNRMNRKAKVRLIAVYRFNLPSDLHSKRTWSDAHWLPLCRPRDIRGPI